jgi:hypothetical protein
MAPGKEYYNAKQKITLEWLTFYCVLRIVRKEEPAYIESPLVPNTIVRTGGGSLNLRTMDNKKRPRSRNNRLKNNLKGENMVEKVKYPGRTLDKQEGYLICKAKDIGLTDYLVCLESSKEGVMCEHRFAFGFDHLCANSVRIEQVRKSIG